MYKGKQILFEKRGQGTDEPADPRELENRVTAWGSPWVEGSFGHGGASTKTNMTIDAKRGLILVWMVQQSGDYPGKANPQAAFQKAADALYAKGKK